MKFLQKIAAECLEMTPEVWDEHCLCELGKKAIFYSGLDGKRNFAWVGLPEGASAEHKVPGVVLVHGGGGTAFPNWVNYWNELGFAAIAMDNCGAIYDVRNEYRNWPRHSFSGPAGWGAFDKQPAMPPRDQWFPHAVAAVINAHTVLRSLPEVDTDRIGITGISWGAVLTCISSGLDPRYKAVCPVYGCGYLTEDSAWMHEFEKMTTEQRDWWRDEWDPANFLTGINAPVLWFNGTNDGAFHTGSWQKSVATVKTPVDVCMKIRWPHGHGPVGEEPKEIAAFFREHLTGGKKRLKVVDATLNGSKLSGRVTGGKFISAVLCFTADSGKWPDREWLTIPAQADGNLLQAELPADWKGAFLQVLSGDYLTSTSQIMIR